jgi:1-phosphofructokinase family hexose kinase
MIVCLAANPSVDRLFEVDRLVKGDIHRPASFVQVAGGKGLNVARAASALGADVCAVAMLRGHSGRWLQEALSAGGVQGEFVWTHGESRSSLSVADRETAGLTEFYEHGEVAPRGAWVELTHVAVSRLEAGGWLTISGSMPRGAPDDGYRDLISEARSLGVRVALDADGVRLSEALPSGPDVVKVNVAEASGLLGVPTARREDSLLAASKIRAMAGGDGHAGIVTRGAEGVMLAAPDGSLFEGILYVRGRYPVGSGDAFLAGLVTALDRGDAWEDAFRMALGAGAANAEMPGAARLDPDRARVLASQAEIHLL